MCASYVCVCVCVFVCSVARLCLTLCDPIDDPIDCSLPGSSVYGIFQAKYWSGFPCLPPGDVQKSNLFLLNWQVDSLPLVPPSKPHVYIYLHFVVYLDFYYVLFLWLLY